MKITIKDSLALNAAMIPVTGDQNVLKGFETLSRWATAQNLWSLPKTKMGRIFYDSYKNTPADKLRMGIFVVASKSLQYNKEFKIITIPQTKCIVGSFEICPQEFGQSWSTLFQWMHDNNHKKSAQHPFEIYHTDYRIHPENKCIVDLYIPIL